MQSFRTEKVKNNALNFYLTAHINVYSFFSSRRCLHRHRRHCHSVTRLSHTTCTMRNKMCAVPWIVKGNWVVNEEFPLPQKWTKNRRACLHTHYAVRTHRQMVLHTPPLKLQTLTIAPTLSCFPLKRSWKMPTPNTCCTDANPNIAFHMFHILSFLLRSWAEYVCVCLCVRSACFWHAYIRIPHKLHIF